MDIGKLATGLMDSLKKATIEYIPDPAEAERKKSKALVGAVATGLAYALPGDHPLLVGVAMSYTIVMGYQAVRDLTDR